MARSFVWRPGNWLIAFHPRVVGWSWLPEFSRYAPNWWSFLWLGVEVSRATPEPDA